MKALTLWQPWATLIADGRKLIETRPRPWYHIGLVAIHAGLYVDREACAHFGYNPDTIVRGKIVAVANKTGCVQFPNAAAPPDDYGNFLPGRYGYLLTNVMRLRAPRAVSGAQGFWNWDTDGLPSTCLKCWIDHLPSDVWDKVTDAVSPF